MLFKLFYSIYNKAGETGKAWTGSRQKRALPDDVLWFQNKLTVP